MKDEFQLHPDDSRLTAYALGELEPTESARVEAAVQADPALRAAVDGIRSAAARITDALETESMAAPAPAAVIPLEAAERPPDEYPRINGRRVHPLREHLLRFPGLYYVVGGLAAAGFAVLVIWHEPPAAAPKRVYQVVDLRGGGESATAKSESSVPVALPTLANDESMAPAGLGLLNQIESGQAKRDIAPPPPFGSGISPAQPPLNERSGGRIVFNSAFAPRVATTNGAPLGTRAAEPAASGTLTLGAAGAVPFGVTDLYRGPRSRWSAQEFPAAPARQVVHNTEAYAFGRDNDFLSAAQNPLSTFSVDVDTASYTNVRRFLEGGRLPPPDAVRIEELLNYFPYRYPPPVARADGEVPPFAASLEVSEAPWAPTHRLVRVGLKAREVAASERPAASLVFLLDVSGSMEPPNKLPLVKESMRLLVERLRPDDRVAIVTYAGTSGLALPSTPASRIHEINEALDALRASGSTNGARGIQLAYDIAKANFMPDGVNRVILCTDGDFNVGATSDGELVRLIEEKAKSGVFLTVLGFGMGNLKDAKLEQLADKGNGHYGYVDDRREAERLLVDQLTGTLVTVAKDVKIQVDFNPAKVGSYRLIGYENRGLKQEDFNDDRVDAGEIGAGHTVTALYEVIPASEQGPGSQVEESKYMAPFVAAKLPAAMANELLTVRVRYKEPAGDVSRKLEFPLTDGGRDFANASADFKFSSAVAAFGMILRDSPHKGRATIGTVIEWAAAGATNAADDPRGYRRDFLDLARRAQTLVLRR